MIMFPEVCCQEGFIVGVTHHLDNAGIWWTLILGALILGTLILGTLILGALILGALIMWAGEYSCQAG